MKRKNHAWMTRAFGSAVAVIGLIAVLGCSAEADNSSEQELWKCWEQLKPSLIVIKTQIMRANMMGGMTPQEASMSGLVVGEGCAIVPDTGAGAPAKKTTAWVEGQEITGDIVGRDETFGIALLKWSKSVGKPATLRVADLRVGKTVALVTMESKERDLGPVMSAVTVTRYYKSGDGMLAECAPMINDARVLAGFDGVPLAFQGSKGMWAMTPSFIQAVKDLVDKKNVPVMTEEERERAKGWLGMTFLPLEKNFAEAEGLDHAKGVRVHQVLTGSPAQAVGFQTNDLITAVDDKPLTLEGAGAMGEVSAKVGRGKPGQTMALTVWRQGKPLTLKCVLGTRPQPKEMYVEEIGIKVQELQPWLKETNQLEEVDGVVVAGITAGTPASSSGLKSVNQETRQPVLTVITAMNGKPLKTWEDFQRVVMEIRTVNMRHVTIEGVTGADQDRFATVLDLRVGAKDTQRAVGQVGKEGGKHE